MGERRYMLEAMLRQRPNEVVGWLLELCDRTLTGYAASDADLYPALGPWRSRIAITRRSLTGLL